MSDRLDALHAILAKDPSSRLGRYGLAMEYAKGGQLEPAMVEFRALIEAHPDFAYAYFHAGQTLERLGRTEEAREIYTRGIAAATDAHARSELQGALDLLG